MGPNGFFGGQWGNHIRRGLLYFVFERVILMYIYVEAYHQVESVAQHINQHIKQQDNFMKMLAIQKSLAGPAAPKILIPGRIFIKEGVLKKVSLCYFLSEMKKKKHSEGGSHPLNASMFLYWLKDRFLLKILGFFST